MEKMNISNTALGAEKAIIFISDAHEKFYYEKLKEVGMNTLEVLTLVLVIFAALTYIDNKHNRK